MMLPLFIYTSLKDDQLILSALLLKAPVLGQELHVLVTPAPGDEFTLELSSLESCEPEQAKVTLLSISLQVAPAVEALTKAPCGICNVQ